MSSSNVFWNIEGSVATLTFNRPQSRNALTWDMYDAVVEACDHVDRAADIRVLVLRGAGGSFSAGTDISQFSNFATAEDGIAYERRLDAVIDRLERVTRITIAAVDGVAAGGGCALALACDFRYCTTRTRVGVPVGRTLGNCLSAANLARLIDRVGMSRAVDLLLSGRLLNAGELAACGFATRVVAPDVFDADVAAHARDLATRSPSTVEATKAALLRIRDHRLPPLADDIVGKCYASEEFREGVRAFLDGRDPSWALRTESSRASRRPPSSTDPTPGAD
jgi:enoyl-CoA hydratase/carnithine racemase